MTASGGLGPSRPGLGNVPVRDRGDPLAVIPLSAVRTLVLSAQGLSVKEIADQRAIAERTVKGHRQIAAQALGLTTAPGSSVVVRILYSLGWIRVPDEVRELLELL